MTKLEPDGSSVVVEGTLREDEEGDLYVPHGIFVTNSYVPDYDPNSQGWEIEILS